MNVDLSDPNQALIALLLIGISALWAAMLRQSKYMKEQLSEDREVRRKFEKEQVERAIKQSGIIGGLQVKVQQLEKGCGVSSCLWKKKQ